MAGVPGETIAAIKDSKPLQDAKLEAVRRMVTTAVEKRSWVPDDEVQVFLKSGNSKSQLLDIMVGVSMKTLSNYINHLVDMPAG
jgi:alkylhydroperoxidase family enzyme